MGIGSAGRPGPACASRHGKKKDPCRCAGLFCRSMPGGKGSAKSCQVALKDSHSSVRDPVMRERYATHQRESLRLRWPGSGSAARTRQPRDVAGVTAQPLMRRACFVYYM